MVELCVYSSTVNKREISIQWIQRNAADVNEYSFNIRFFLLSDREMTKSILILEFYQLNKPTHGTHYNMLLGPKGNKESQSDELKRKKKNSFHWNREKGMQIQTEKKRILSNSCLSQLVTSCKAINCLCSFSYTCMPSIQHLANKHMAVLPGIQGKMMTLIEIKTSPLIEALINSDTGIQIMSLCILPIILF